MLIQLIDTLVFTRFDVFTQFGGSFTVNIPYICQQCGQCCKEVSFPDPKSFANIIKSFKIDLQLLSKQFLKNSKCEDHSEIMRKLCQIKPCIFLQEDMCSIYSQRPLICREWFPRVRSKCPAYFYHNHMCQAILQNRKYRVGIREIIFIGNQNPNPSYPSVPKLGDIEEHTFFHYYSPPEDEIVSIWETFLTFNPKYHERLIFKTINPVMKLLY